MNTDTTARRQGPKARSALATRPFAPFQFCRWPLEALEERVREAPELFTERARSTRFPIRAIRYWWAHCALLGEAELAGRELDVADLGCSTGILRRYMGAVHGTRWTGLDWKIDRDRLREVGYDDAVQCDFDRTLPVPDESFDVAIQLHVIEHLPRPEFSFAEMARIIRPGGLLLVGSPVMPPLLSRLRELRHRRRWKLGLQATGRHINSMDPVRWRRLARENGLEVELESGAFLARWSGNPLENHAWWLRLNMAWGAAVPSLGGEIYLALRKPGTRGPAVTAACGSPRDRGTAG